MKTLLAAFLATFTAAWYLDLASTTFPASSATLWIVRQQALTLTGLLSIALMSLAMLLSTRPRWLEKPLGGLDRIYRLHKWSGILAVAFGLSHWLVKLSSDMIKSMIGSEGRLPKIKYDGFLEVLRELGKDMGEPALYIGLAMLALALWRRVPYHLWRHLHRVMPVLYLMLAVHAALLAPPAYWTQAAGALLGGALAVGVVASFISLAGLIGRQRQVKAAIVAFSQHGDVTELTCQLDVQWRDHRPGQFAFITFDWLEGAHPFTIASAERGDRTISFCIKALGNFTSELAQKIEVGQAVSIEGPYGRFLLERSDPSRRQVWIAGGIGITPFLAWLEALQSPLAKTRRADLHYCTRDRQSDPFVARLQALCTALPGIRLQVHSALHGERLTADALQLTDERRAEIWFCGPSGLAQALRKCLPETRRGRLRFHQEAFELR